MKLKKKVHPVKSRKAGVSPKAKRFNRARKPKEPSNVLFDSQEGSTESLFINNPNAKEIKKLENYLKGFDIRFYND